jgi:hypothetical protein
MHSCKFDYESEDTFFLSGTMAERNIYVCEKRICIV